MITTLHGDADRSADGRSLVYCPIPVRPRKAGCDNGPLMMGASAGAASGAGIRLCKTCIRGAPKPPRPNPLPKPAPCATPPRAKPGVDPTTQATANTAAKRRCMIAFLLLFCLPYAHDLIIRRDAVFAGLR